MTVEFRLPEVSESMASARIAQWLKREGDLITAGEPLLEVETDKTTVEVEAPASGRLGQILVTAGAGGLSAGQVLATIQSVVPGATAAPVPAPQAPAVTAHKVAAAPIATPAAPSAEQAAGANGRTHEHVLATPLARRMALVLGLDLGRIAGTGTGGRVVKVDVERLIAPIPAPVPPVAAPADADKQPARAEDVAPNAAFADQPLSAMRRVTAARLLQSKQTIPHFYLEVECVVDELMGVRQRLAASDPPVKLTLTDFAVRAAALALRKVPAVNASWAGETVRRHEATDICVAVNTPSGLIAPIVRSADRKTLGAISEEIRTLAARARAGQLRPDEYTNGTFTISNLGMFGVTSLYAIVNPPQSAILGIGATMARPIVREGLVTVGTTMTCTLSADHRVIDGAEGAQWLAEFRKLIEQPWLLVL